MRPLTDPSLDEGRPHLGLSRPGAGKSSLARFRAMGGSNMEQELGDLAELAGEFPGWEFEGRWVTVGTGPDRRCLMAVRGGVTLVAMSAAGLRRKILKEQE